MTNIQSILGKVRRVAKASFENAVRLHEDAIFLFDENRIPSALHTSVLSIDELASILPVDDVMEEIKQMKAGPTQRPKKKPS